MGRAENEQLNEFQKDVEEMVKAFNDDPNLSKQELPGGLTKDEQAYFEKTAHGYGLAITRIAKFNKTSLFMTKPDSKV